MAEETSAGVLAVLGYHQIGPPPPGGWETWSYVPEETFADHLRLLRETGWQVIDLARSGESSAAGYRAACLYGGGPSPIPPADAYFLPRLAMGPDTDLRALLGTFSPDVEA